MVNTEIGATVVAHSLNEQGDELISVLCSCDHETLKTLYQHDDLSITSTNILEIPFNKMVEAVQNDPFIPIAWQKEILYLCRKIKSCISTKQQTYLMVKFI